MTRFTGDKFLGVDSGASGDEQPADTALLHYLRNNLHYLSTTPDRCSDGPLMRLEDPDAPADALTGRTFASLGRAVIRIIPLQISSQVDSIDVDLFGRSYEPYDIDPDAGPTDILIELRAALQFPGGVTQSVTEVGEGFSSVRLTLDVESINAESATLFVTMRSLQSNIEEAEPVEEVRSETILEITNGYSETETEDTGAPRVSNSVTYMSESSLVGADHIVVTPDEFIAVSNVPATSLGGASLVGVSNLSRYQLISTSVAVRHSGDRVSREQIRANIVEESTIFNRLRRWSRSLYRRPRLVSIGTQGDYVDDTDDGWPSSHRSVWPYVDGADGQTEMMRTSFDSIGGLADITIPFFAIGTHQDERPVDGSGPAGPDIAQLFEWAASATWRITVSLETKRGGPLDSTDVLAQESRVLRMEHLPGARMIGLPMLAQLWWQRWHTPGEERRFTYGEGMIREQDTDLIDDLIGSLDVRGVDPDVPVDVAVYAELVGEPTFNYTPNDGLQDTDPKRDPVEPDAYHDDPWLRLHWVGHSVYVSRDTDDGAPYVQEAAAGDFEFTPAGATGRTGPDQLDVDAAYDETNLDGDVTVIGDGIQVWNIPQDGKWQITAYGAAGGDRGTRPGGMGAVIETRVDLDADDTLRVLVGQMGTESGTNAAGGGGGTFVAVETDDGDTMFDGQGVRLLAAAGGGGGAGADNIDAAHGVDGEAGLEGANDRQGWTAVDGDIGTAGHGGHSGDPAGNSGGGGGGYLSDGAPDGSVDSSYGDPGQGFLNGGVGGQGNNPDEMGGFGGGGSTPESLSNSNCSAGAGGGYSGGTGGNRESADTGVDDRVGGGGGGSFAAGKGSYGASGINDDDGRVIIRRVG